MKLDLVVVSPIYLENRGGIKVSSNYKPYPYLSFSNDNRLILKEIKDRDTGKKMKVRVCDALWIDEIIENIDEKTILAKIDFLYIGQRKSIIAKREEYMNLQNILRFQREGLDVMHTNVKDVIAHLKNEEYQAPRTYQHSKLGFDLLESQTIFKHYKCLGSQFHSTYNGKYAIKPKGDRDQWFEMFRKEVQGHAPLELICIISLSALVLGYIGESIGLDNIICHLTGNSTTGKSTAMKLAISMFGYPDVKDNGLFTSYNSTANALIKALAGIKGVPLAFDEISMANNRDFSNLVYKLANGVDKSRLNKNSELRDKDTWLTTILSNGEESIIQSSSNAGLFNRVFEFNGISWTKNASNAENINKIILKNYGFIGCEFVEYIMQQGQQQVTKIYESSKRKLKGLFMTHHVNDSFIDRRINRHAIFLTTAILFQKAFGVKLQIKEILNLLIDVERESIEKRNFDKTTIDYLSNLISINIDKFNFFTKPKSLSDPIYAKKECWGNVTKSESGIEIEINPIIFEKFLSQAGYKSSDIVLKELRDSGYLDHEKGKLYRKRKNNLGKLSKVYVVKVRNEDEDERFNHINQLLDNVSDHQKRTLLLLEKERLRREYQGNQKLEK